MYVVTRDQMIELDRAAIEDYLIPAIVLMENAGRAVADLARRKLPSGARPGGVAVVVGRGNNGGDGLVAARHLENAGIPAEIFLTDPKPQKGYVGRNFDVAVRMGLPVRDISAWKAEELARELGRFSLVIDAVFGTGLRGTVRPSEARFLEGTNDCGSSVLAVDVPSGLDCDSGEPMGTAVRAKWTVTFAAAKKGFLTESGRSYVGELVVADIGIPRKLLEPYRV